ncbi:MAG: flagellar biosynthesis protein FlhA [Spirochaetales bacterium]|nr:flagellar biosynthesis protein FlhA [Spirochaetales bacterium]
MSDAMRGERAPSGLFSRGNGGLVSAAPAIAIVMCVIMILAPLPAFLLDTLMAFNLTLSLLIILITLYTSRALEFSSFPTVLLGSTLFGLALNVSSTRLILAQGEKFDGRMIRAFASFVVGTQGNEGIVIGFIIFIIIIAAQAIVITKGATRVGEVAARFTLDSLPGKQMAIEAEYSSGLISEEEATRKKRDLQKEADFYGAMDGSSKFVSGNVIVGIIITVVNIIGGLVVGVILHGESWQSAITNYITFAVGDGLVSQLPALLVSTATGIIVTRASADGGSFGELVTKQFTLQRRIYWLAGGFLFGMALLPGFPGLVLIPMAGVCFLLGYTLRKKSAEAQREPSGAAREKRKEAEADFSPVVPLDDLSMELGYGLLSLVNKEQGADLLDRVTRMRRETAVDIGLVVPKIHIIDNMRLDPPDYCLKIKGIEAGRGSLRLGCYLAIGSGPIEEEIPGEKTLDPTFGLEALWITESLRDRAEKAGYTVVDLPSIIVTHLTEVIKRNAADILGRQETQAMLDALKKNHPALVEEVLKNLGLGEIQKTLQNLLRERVSIRNMVKILETLADYGSLKNITVAELTEKTRQSLGRQICLQYAEAGTLRFFTLAPKLEEILRSSRADSLSGAVMAALKPDIQRKWINALANAFRLIKDQGHYPLILSSEPARPVVKASTLRDFPDLVVLSAAEIAPDMKLESFGEIKLEG